MKMKKAVPWILSLMLVFTMIPALGTAAHAEDGGTPAISIGAGNIEKGNKVYMGVRLLGSDMYTESPISWIVLGGANSSDLKTKYNGVVSSENARLLITEKTQGNVEFNPYGQSNTWQGSNIQDWCSRFITGKDLGQDPVTDDQYRVHFTSYEQNAMLQTSKTDAEYATDEDEDLEWGTSSLNEEQLFLLSAEEVSDDYGYFNGGESRKAYQHDMDEGIDWWLRSPHRDYTQGAAMVRDSDGNVDGGHVRDKHGVRPACNLDLTSVLFTSAAVGGKTTGEAGPNVLTAISDNTTNEWKLTLKDKDRGFKASAADEATLEMEKGYSDWSIPLVVDQKKAGDNEYVSVILCDSKGIAKYYCNLTQKFNEDVVYVYMPTGLAAGNYTMYVFNEQINGDKMTDYASDFSTFELTVKGTVAHTVTVNKGTADKESAVEGEKVTITADEPESGKQFKEWTGADGLTFTSGNASTEAATFKMPDKDVTVTATYEDISAVSTPVFSPEGGTYASAQNVTISCATDGADIYYTADGTDPTTDSTKYTGAIPVDSTNTIKAIAVKSGMINSAVASAIYTIEDAPAPPEPIKVTIPTGKTLTYDGKTQTGVSAGTGYTLSGTVSAVKAGSYKATAALNDGYVWSDGMTAAKTIDWKINKAANPLKIGAKTATAKYSKLKKKNQTLAVSKVIKFTKKLNDKKTYTLVSAKKGSKSFKKYFKINKSTGKVTIKKNSKMKKGTYKVKVKVQALGNSNYKASAVKAVTFKVKIK